MQKLERVLELQDWVEKHKFHINKVEVSLSYAGLILIPISLYICDYPGVHPEISIGLQASLDSSENTRIS